MIATLRDLQTTELSYNSTIGVWAERINGQFSLDSKCRIGEFQFDNGGVLDDWVIFESCEVIEDYVHSFLDGVEDPTGEYRAMAIAQLIVDVNSENPEANHE